jgi:hypothetical protein
LCEASKPLLRSWRILLIALVMAPLLPAHAQGTPVAEYAVKSALLFKLPQFVYRPGAGEEPLLTMCLLGSNPFGNALEKLAETPIDGRKVWYRKLSSMAEAQACAFVFISRSEAGNLDNILRVMAKGAVVTVSDIEGFAKAGGMVEFALGGEGAAIGILINRKSAQKQSIEFNAQLLRLARVVEP